MIRKILFTIILSLSCAATMLALEPTDTTLTSLDLSTDTVLMLECYGPVFYENVYSVGILTNAGNS